MIAEQASVHGWVAIAISVVALLITFFWNWRLTSQAKRSADAAEKMASIASDTHRQQISPRIFFNTYERSKLRITHQSRRALRLESIRCKVPGLPDSMNAINSAVIQPKEPYDFQLPDLLLKRARDSKKDLQGWIIVDDLTGRRWKQEWGFASDGRRAWGGGIEELET